jgi:hypothetical protein
MNGIEKQAAFYRGYLTDQRSHSAAQRGLAPLTIMLTSII